MAYGLDLLAQQPQTGEMTANPALAQLAATLDERLASMKERQALVPQAPQQASAAGVNALLSPYQAAIAGSPSDTSTGSSLDTLAGLMGQQGQQGQGFGGATGGYQFGNAFKPAQDLVSKAGVTLQQSAMANLMQNPQLGMRVLQSIGQGYRDLAGQRAAYAAYQNGTGNLAARPGHSYHNYGLAFDTNATLGPKLVNYLEQLGWRRQVPGEPWHWSIGNAPWGGN